MANTTSNLSKVIANRLFRKIGGLVIDFTTGEIGFQKSDGIVTLTKTVEGGGDAAEVLYSTSLNPIAAFSRSIPAFAVQVPLNQVEPGDIICNTDEVLGWVTKVNANSLKFLRTNGQAGTIVPQKTAILNMSGVLVVKNLFNLAGGTQDGFAGLQNSLLPLLLLGEKGGSDKLDSLLPLFLMQTMSPKQAGAAGAAAANPMANMLPFLLMGGKGGKGGLDPMMLMAMSGGFGGGAAGANPLGNPMMLMALAGDDSDIDPLTLMALSGGATNNPMMLMALAGGLGGDVETETVPALQVRGAAPVAAAVPPLQTTRRR